MSCPLGYVALQDLKVGGQRLFTPHLFASARVAVLPRSALGGGGAREAGERSSLATRRRQLPLGPGEQQAPEREGRDCRSGFGLPGRERSPWHLKRQALAPGTRVFPTRC